ncbi:MAG: hypothetical protein U5N55_01535 [Cypionkella sp.]|nr:hypothetical protein [Cypionkella sp.]
MSKNDLGTIVAIATGLPSTFDESGYEAMTWVNIAGLQSIGEVGDEHETISVPDLTGKRIRTIKGAAIGATIPIALYEVDSDAGQAAAELAAKGSDGEYSFRVSGPGTKKQYFSGVCMSWKRTERSTGSYAGYTFSVTTNYATVMVA